jgi:hypothetical protein
MINALWTCPPREVQHQTYTDALTHWFWSQGINPAEVILTGTAPYIVRDATNQLRLVYLHTVTDETGQRAWCDHGDGHDAAQFRNAPISLMPPRPETISEHDTPGPRTIDECLYWSDAIGTCTRTDSTHTTLRHTA